MSQSENTKPIYRGYRYRIYPDSKEEKIIIKTIEAAKEIYNFTLAERLKNDSHSKPDFDYRSLAVFAISKAKEFTGINPQIGFYVAISVNSACVKAKQTGQTPLPKNNKRPIGSFTLKDPKPRIIVSKGRRAKVEIKGFGTIDMIYHREIPKGATFHTFTISRNKVNQYFISFECECPQPFDRPQIKKAIGLDFSVPKLYVSSDKTVFADPERIHQYEKHELLVKRAQTKLARCQKGSKNYEKQRDRIARIHLKIVNSRTDFIHKETAKLSKNFDFVGIETLTISDLSERYRFYKRAYDDSWQMFVFALKYKMEYQKKIVAAVPRYYPSSKTCHRCGNIKRDLTLQDRIYTCPRCHASVDRDVNAAKNIRDQALRNAGFKIRYVAPNLVS